MRRAFAPLIALVFGVLIGVPGFAQGPPPPPPDLGRALHSFVYMGARGDWGKTVTGAPYSAEVVTETTQTLSDGNRIDRKETGAVYRDAAGRTRQERTISMIGPWPSADRPVENVTIRDPVAHVTYILNPARKSAYELKPGSQAPPGIPRHGRMRRRAGEPFGTASTQSLGTRTIEGVKAEGTRRTLVIPAGKIGNEKPITIVSESWYSPELHVYVLTKLIDPRFGDTTYRLVNIKLGEPSASLFRVPSDYTIRNTSPQRRFGTRAIPGIPAPPRSAN